MSHFTLHKMAIRALHLLDPRIETKSFRKKLLELLTSLAQEIYDSDPDNHSKEWSFEESLNSYHCIELLKNEFKDLPDAFVIDKEREEILIFEVEDYHPMPANKAWRIIDLADSISWEFDWTVRVFVSDRYANLKELDVEVLQASMIHELGEIDMNKNAKVGKREKVHWHPRCMGVRHTCRKCGKLLKGNELYDHRYDCGTKL